MVVEVLPADLRPPWFLPCVYNDSNTCIQAQYEATLPINVSLVLRRASRAWGGEWAWEWAGPVVLGLERGAKQCGAGVPRLIVLVPCRG